MRNTFPSLNLNSTLADGTPSRFVSAPFNEPPETGAGSGGASSSSDDGGAAGSGDGGAGGGVQSYKLTDDSLVDFGDGKPVKWGEARQSRYMDRASYDRGVEFLTTIAKQMEVAQGGNGSGGNAGGRRPTPQTRQANGQFAQGQPGQGQQQRQSSINLDELENLAVADGRTLAKLTRALQAEGLAPLGSAVMQMASRIQQLEGQLTNVQKTSGILAEQHTSKEFEDFITTSLKGVPEIKGLGMINADDPFIREMAKDVFLSHDQKDASLMKEFPKMLSDRINAAIGFVANLQKAAVEASKQKRRAFFQPNGGGVKPTGAGGFQFKSGADLAREFFGAQEATT